MRGLGQWLGDISWPLVSKILAALGIGTVTYAGLDAAMTAALDVARNSLSGLTPDVMGVLALAGVFDAMGIIAGGMMTAVTFATLKRFALHTTGGR